MLQALVLAAHAIEATTAATGPHLLATRAPVQVRLRDGETGKLEGTSLLTWELCPMAWLLPFAPEVPTFLSWRKVLTSPGGRFLKKAHASISAGEAQVPRIVLSLSPQ